MEFYLGILLGENRKTKKYIGFLLGFFNVM